jgi:hypothetical protein
MFLAKAFFSTYKTRTFISVFTRSHRWTIPRARGSQSTLSHVISLIFIRMYSSHLSLCLRNNLFCKYKIFFCLFIRNYTASARLLEFLEKLCVDSEIIKFTVTSFRARQNCFLGSKINVLKLTTFLLQPSQRNYINVSA